eukprot:GFUD01032624.1.p1 GENE.GFUD01032624.1~~GFUD01032624.1.p1  ORF type:complete len:132 (+),score=18.89 GFUD01032624.1:46-441(+)
MILFLSLLSLILPCHSLSASCPGCPETAPVDHRIVAFAVHMLEERDENCKLTATAVENFQIQIVAGVNYSFDLVVKHSMYKMYTDSSCNSIGFTESCHVEVSEKSWEKVSEKSWEKVTQKKCQACHTIFNL